MSGKRRIFAKRAYAAACRVTASIICPRLRVNWSAVSGWLGATLFVMCAWAALCFVLYMLVLV